MSGPAVLVVEDVPQIRATAVQLFQELGCEVFDAYNGHGALKILEARPAIQVLFADVRMSGMSGPELAQAVRRLRSDLSAHLRTHLRICEQGRSTGRHPVCAEAVAHRGSRPSCWSCSNKRQMEPRESRLRSARKLELPPATPEASLPTQLGRARGHSIHSPRVLSFHEAGPGQRDDTARLQSGAHGRSPPGLEPESWASDVERACVW
jgi:CheY-like chemotaxis protein